MAFKMRRPIIKGTAAHKASIAKQMSIVSQARTQADPSLSFAAEQLGRSRIGKSVDYTIDPGKIEIQSTYEKELKQRKRRPEEKITIDKKPPKGVSPKGYDYFADCYWFLCRGDFYSKHNIWVDWIRGDNNHLATITCYDKGLKYLHLPGFYETKETNRKKFLKQHNFNLNVGNLHTFNDKPFLIHRKGGTGLYRILEGKR